MFRMETSKALQSHQGPAKNACARVRVDTATANRFGDLIADWLGMIGIRWTPRLPSRDAGTFSRQSACKLGAPEAAWSAF
ncbi:hypothetical protein CN071_24745 [Sinorhizobium meliloti]|nr:hypothetical protein CN071_24745 [Sinorhizobium meliloti]